MSSTLIPRQLSGMSSDNADKITADERQSFSHDLRHSLYALRTGIDLLPHIRNDSEHFEEVHELLIQEIRTASDLLDEMLTHR